jgi:signal peptidase I
VRDVSPPSGLSGDDLSDTTGAPGARDRGRQWTGQRHLAASGVGDGAPLGARRPRTSSPVGGWSTTRDGTTPQDGDGRSNGQDGDDPGGEKRPQQQSGHSLLRVVLEWLAVLAGGIVIAVVVEAFLVQAFWIPSPSMVPTLEVGDRVLVNKLAYKAHEVHRGDVVVFERPPQAAANGGEDQIKDLIKRVVAVGGDSLEARDGRLYVNNELIDEPYLPEGTQTEDLPYQVVPEGKVFVMGDNRGDSQDSRFFGPIDEDSIVGRAFVKVLPFTDVGWL